MASPKNLQHPPSGLSKSTLLGIFAVFFIVVIAGGTVLYSFSDWSGRARAKKLQNPFPATAEALSGAQVDYRAHCQSCHGVNGDGKGERAERLSVAPADGPLCALVCQETGTSAGTFASTKTKRTPPGQAKSV